MIFIKEGRETLSSTPTQCGCVQKIPQKNDKKDELFICFSDILLFDSCMLGSEL